MLAALNRLLGRAPAPDVPPHPLIQTCRDHFRTFDPATPLADCAFTVLDTELTGLRPGHDEIVSIGAIRIRDLAIVPAESFHTLVRPQNPQATAATLIHRLTPADLATAPPLTSALPGFLAYLGPTLIVGHHIDLDMAFLNAACHTHLGGVLPNPCLDTMRMARIHEQATPPLTEVLPSDHAIAYNLPALTTRYGLPRFPAHDALSDATQTAYLFLYLLRKIRSGRLRTLADLWKAGKAWWLR